MWTRRRAARCATDTNKHQCRPQIKTSLSVCCVAAEHLARASVSQHMEKCQATTVEILFPVYIFLFLFFIVMLQDVEPWLYTACCCKSSGLRPQPSGDLGLSHLHSSKPAGCNSKIIASSRSSRKAWCVCYLHDSSLQGWQLNQHFATIYHQLAL